MRNNEFRYTTAEQALRVFGRWATNRGVNQGLGNAENLRAVTNLARASGFRYVDPANARQAKALLNEIPNVATRHERALVELVGRNDVDAMNALLRSLHPFVRNELLHRKKVITSFMSACLTENEPVAKAFLRWGIDPNVRRPETYMSRATPLIEAASRGLPSIVRMLLERPGIRVNDANRFGSTALHIACSKSRGVAANRDRYPAFREVIRLLLAAPGIDVNKGDVAGITPLMLAARSGNAVIFEMLLSAPGVDMAAVNDRGQTVYNFARISGMLDVLERFVERRRAKRAGNNNKTKNAKKRRV